MKKYLQTKTQFAKQASFTKKSKLKSILFSGLLTAGINITILPEYNAAYQLVQDDQEAIKAFVEKKFEKEKCLEDDEDTDKSEVTNDLIKNFSTLKENGYDKSCRNCSYGITCPGGQTVSYQYPKNNG